MAATHDNNMAAAQTWYKHYWALTTAKGQGGDDNNTQREAATTVSKGVYASPIPISSR